MTEPARSEATQDRQVPRHLRIFHGTGAIADGVKNATFNAFLVLYYTTVLELPGTLSGLAIFIAMCVDAISDPLMGSISDGFRSRWGRRHPFMYFAAIPMGLCVYGLFAPPEGLDQQGLFLWLVAFAIGVRLFLTFFMVPSNALGPEMTTHYDERTTLASYRWLIGWGGAILVTSAGWLFFLSDGEGPLGAGRLNADNFPALGLFAGVLVTTAILVSSAGTHKLIPTLRQTQNQGAVFSFRRFFGEIRTALRSHSLRVILGSSLLSMTALGISEVLGTYMNTWFWEFTSDQLGTLALLSVIPLIVGVALVRPISQRMDKRTAAIRLSLFAILFGPTIVLLRFAGLAPENGDPLLLLLIIGHGALMVGSLIQIGILNSSMIMDAVDEAELQSGVRQEGVFMAAVSFTGKAVSGFGNFLGGVLLDVIEFPTGSIDAAVGSVPDEAIFKLGLIHGPGLVIFHLGAVWFISRLRLTRASYAEISEELAKRAE